MMEADSLIRSLLENTPATIYAVDRKGKILFVNRIPSELGGKNMAGVDALHGLPAPEAARVRQIWDDVLRTGVAQSYDTMVVRPDGTPAWYRAMAAVWKQAHHDDALIINALDVTDEKRAEEGRRRRETQLEEASRLAPVGSWEWDLRTDESVPSREYLRILGLPDDHKILTPAERDAMTHPEDRTRVNDMTRQVREGLTTMDLEYRIVRPGGEIRTLRTRGRVVPGAQGRPARMVGASIDVTDAKEAEEVRRFAFEKSVELENLKTVNILKSRLLENVVEETTKRKQAEDELRAANSQLLDLVRFKAELLNILSHELGNPMTPIRLQIHMLKQDSGNLTEVQQKSVAILERNVDRVVHLSQDMLDVARLETGHMKIDRAPMSVGEVVREAAESFEEQAARTGVALALDIEPGLWSHIDPRRIEQVVFNLVSNALKFTPKGGRIDIHVHPHGTMAVIDVKDTGIGYTAEQEALLFKPFSRIHEDQRNVATGTGLGLYISRGIVEQHGGTLTSASPGPNHGATFTIQLPLSRHRLLREVPT